MALKDFFKKKKPKEKIAEKTEKIKIEKPIEELPRMKEEKNFTEIYRILKSPHITEKATDLTKQNQYIFKVCQRANKTEIKKAIENFYGVNVLSVKIINAPAKKRRLGRIEGWRREYKKAIVKIKEGQKIEILPR